MHHIDADKTYTEKARMSHIEQILEAAPHESNSCTDTYLPSLKPSKKDKQDMWDTAGEARMKS